MHGLAVQQPGCNHGITKTRTAENPVACCIGMQRQAMMMICKELWSVPGSQVLREVTLNLHPIHGVMPAHEPYPELLPRF